MIIIKYKGKRTPIYIPRNGEGAVEYATDLDIQELDDKIQKTNQSLHGLEYALEQATETFNDFVEEYNRVSEDWATEEELNNYYTKEEINSIGYATEEYVAMQINNTLGTLNNELEEILN